MSYFESVNSKSFIKDAQPIEKDPALLAEYLKKQKSPIESNLKAVDDMFKKWCDILFCGYNIVIQGPLSKFRLLETFNARYLESNRIPNLDYLWKEVKSPILSIKTVRLHGFTPVSLERFCHFLFDIKDERKMNEEDIEMFVNKTRESETHFVFLIHSFELFYSESRKVWDLISQLNKLEPQLVHILLSSDHIHSNKILNYLKPQLRLIFFLVPYGESFFHERTHSVGVMNEDNDAITQIFNDELNLQSVKDVYQALQDNAKKILKYILETHISEAPSNSKLMSLESLLKFCQNEFIVRRACQLKNHLGELKDHRIIEMDERENIICLVSRSNAKKLLEQVFEQD